MTNASSAQSNLSADPPTDWSERSSFFKFREKAANAHQPAVARFGAAAVMSLLDHGPNIPSTSKGRRLEKGEQATVFATAFLVFLKPS